MRNFKTPFKWRIAMKRLKLAILSLGSLSVVSCMDLSCMQQYNPKPFWDQLTQERKIAHAPKKKLTPQGTLANTNTTEKKSSIDLQQAEKDYTQLCASCHGPQGKGDTPMAQALNPSPRDFSSPEWKVSDEHIAKVIREGGASVGLSPLMAPWGSILDKKRIDDLVIKIRNFKKQ
jgi:mono/diheme cytochrome c family protein